MEKRLLLAAAISFGILFLWNIVFPPPKSQTVKKESQTIEDKDVETLSSTNLSESKVEDFSEEKYTWTTDRFELEFTNKGGNIDKITLLPYHQVLPVNKILGAESLNQKKFQLTESSKTKIVYVHSENGQYTKKEYNINENNGLLNVSISGNGVFDQKDVQAYELNLSILGDVNKIPNYHQENSLYEYVVNSGKDIFRRAKAHEFVSEKNDKIISGNNQWTAFRNRYYCAIIKPDFETEATKIETKDKHNLEIYWDVSRETSKNNFNIAATVYLGPEEGEALKSLGLGFEKIKRFYNLGIFEWPAKFIYFLLHSIHKFIPLWGICILLISLLVYLATYPLTFKSMVSMRKMQQIQPEVAALRDKYKDNPQQMNAEMMAIYHRYGINPLSGCLPMLLQMPVFIGLYQVLWRDVSFKGQKFLWIHDLSEPDRLIVFSQSLPLIGHDLNLLPLLMVVIMFVQQKMNMKSTIVTDETQMMQQKMMMYIMPVLLGFIFYKFSSGLTLYFVIFYLMSTLTQWKFLQGNGSQK